jgi:hypothetical protein
LGRHRNSSTAEVHLESCVLWRVGGGWERLGGGKCGFKYLNRPAAALWSGVAGVTGSVISCTCVMVPSAAAMGTVIVCPGSGAWSTGGGLQGLKVERAVGSVNLTGASAFLWAEVGGEGGYTPPPQERAPDCLGLE